MKYIKSYEKYTHTKQDSIDDMIYIQEFSQKFEDEFEYRLNLDTKSGDLELKSFLGHGAWKWYFGEVEIFNKNILSKKVKIKYHITIETDINPSGITKEDDIGRTFKIKFDIDEHKSRNVNRVKHFSGYSRDMDDILERFDEYLIRTLNIRPLTAEEKKQKEFEKKERKFNL